MKRQLFSVCFALVLSDCVFGQGVGTIHGTVTDASGKAVPRAKVTAVLEGRGTTRTIDTDEQGSYVFPSLPVGSYALRIEAAGFKTSARSGVEWSCRRTKTPAWMRLSRWAI